jgi:putative membrane protein
MTRFMHKLSGVAAAVSLACAATVFAQPATQNPAQTGTRNPAENTVSPSKEMTTPGRASTSGRTGITSTANTPGASSGSSTSGAMTGSTSGSTGSSTPGAMTGSSSSGARGSAASGSSNASLTSTDRTFVTKAAQIGLAEVQTGQLAKEKGATDQAKQYGDHMVSDHTKANDELKKIAGEKQVSLPTAPAAKDQATLKRLQGMSGAAFDRAYLDSQIAGHKEAIKEFQTEAKSGRDPGLKAFASSTLPELQEHLRMATDAAKTTKASSREKTGGSSSARASAAQ